MHSASFSLGSQPAHIGAGQSEIQAVLQILDVGSSNRLEALAPSGYLRGVPKCRFFPAVLFLSGSRRRPLVRKAASPMIHNISFVWVKTGLRVAVSIVLLAAGVVALGPAYGSPFPQRPGGPPPPSRCLRYRAVVEGLANCRSSLTRRRSDSMAFAASLGPSHRRRPRLLSPVSRPSARSLPTPLPNDGSSPKL